MRGAQLQVVRQQAQAGRQVAAQVGHRAQLLQVLLTQRLVGPALAQQLHSDLGARGPLAAGLRQQRAGGGVQRGQLQAGGDRAGAQVAEARVHVEPERLQGRAGWDCEQQGWE